MQLATRSACAAMARTQAPTVDPPSERSQPHCWPCSLHDGDFPRSLDFLVSSFASKWAAGLASPTNRNRCPPRRRNLRAPGRAGSDLPASRLAHRRWEPSEVPLEEHSVPADSADCLADKKKLRAKFRPSCFSNVAPEPTRGPRRRGCRHYSKSVAPAPRGGGQSFRTSLALS